MLGFNALASSAIGDDNISGAAGGAVAYLAGGTSNNTRIRASSVNRVLQGGGRSLNGAQLLSSPINRGVLASRYPNGARLMIRSINFVSKVRD